MRVLVDLGSHLRGSPEIVQVDHSEMTGVAGATNMSGKFSIPIPNGVDFPVDTSSYVLPIDGGDVTSIAYAHLLAKYPMFGNIYFNPLLIADHLNELEFSAPFRDTFTNPPNIYLYPMKAQLGTPSPNAQQGTMPMGTALLPQNSLTTPIRPGMLMTKEIDIGPYTLDAFGHPVGADHFLLYWKVYEMGTTDDITSNGMDQPSAKLVAEGDQEPSGFFAYLSPDNGTTWCQTGLLEPVAFCDKTTRFRVAFLNWSPNKIYLASYAVLF